MEAPETTYLILMLGTILLPFVLSFDKKVHFYRRWKFLYRAILIPAFIFIVWDIIFTYYGVWSFSDDYTIGLDILFLPIEEWLFFLFVPYACVFVYDVVKYYWPNFNNILLGKWMLIAFIVLSVFLVLSYTDRIYTLVVSSILLIVLVLQFFVSFSNQYLFRFFVAYLVCLIPFFIVNGVLTFLPVVSYDNTENLHLRFFSIPVEDALYFMTLFLMNISLYERGIIRSKKSY